MEKASEDVSAAAKALRTVRPGGHRSSRRGGWADGCGRGGVREKGALGAGPGGLLEELWLPWLPWSPSQIRGYVGGGAGEGDGVRTGAFIFRG